VAAGLIAARAWRLASVASSDALFADCRSEDRAISAFMNELMNKQKADPRVPIKMHDTCYVHRSATPGAAKFVASMKPVGVMRSLDALHSIPSAQRTSPWLSSFVKHRHRGRVRDVPL
jgi:hypothetical protein